MAGQVCYVLAKKLYKQMIQQWPEGNTALQLAPPRCPKSLHLNDSAFSELQKGCEGILESKQMAAS